MHDGQCLTVGHGGIGFHNLTALPTNIVNGPIDQGQTDTFPLMSFRNKEADQRPDLFGMILLVDNLLMLHV